MGDSHFYFAGFVERLYRQISGSLNAGAAAVLGLAITRAPRMLPHHAAKDESITL